MRSMVEAAAGNAPSERHIHHVIARLDRAIHAMTDQRDCGGS
jgi:hypothetical protein